MKGYEGMSFKRGGENDAGVGNSSSKTGVFTGESAQAIVMAITMAADISFNALKLYYQLSTDAVCANIGSDR